MSYIPNQIIVVGGGLSGLSAAHTILEQGGRVLLLDKNSFMGGNSTKATSGINGALTTSQIKLGIQDSVDAFLQDTVKSSKVGHTYPLAEVLTGESAPAVEWLMQKFKLDLSLVSRLGGHSFPRTHRGGERFPGMTITYALMEKLEEVAAKTPEQAKIVLKARATDLITNASGEVIGVKYTTKDGQAHEAFGPVILATGGYAADKESDSLLKKYRPDILKFPTTNGAHATGDGIKMALRVGADLKDIDKVQVHPTGLVHPDEPDNPVKFLAAEALRGVGGIMIDRDGKRFVNELGTRDFVSGEMMRHDKAPYRLVLNGKASKEIEWHCKHYCGRKLMKQYSNVADIAKDMGVSADVLKNTFEQHNIAEKNKKDPFGKIYFQNGPWKAEDTFHVAIITPVSHYCMGGVKVNADTEVESATGTMTGLFAAGEVMGGTHGANRLGGSSLLDCVVFGRVAGRTAARFLLSKLISNVDTGALKAGAAVAAPAPAAPVAAPAAEEKTVQKDGKALKVYTAEEVAKHNTEKDCWCVVNGMVLDVTSFLDEHPGGKQAILLFAGRDATEEFLMLHKLDVIDKYAPECVIGALKGAKVQNKL